MERVRAGGGGTRTDWKGVIMQALPQARGGWVQIEHTSMDVSRKREGRLKNWSEEWVDVSTVERGNVARAHFVRDIFIFLSTVKENAISPGSICGYQLSGT